MRKALDVLTYPQLLSAYQTYKDTASLEKTATWVTETFGIVTNRHHLSWKFKSMDLDVRPPNGREAVYWRDTSNFATFYGKVAADMVQLAVEDFFAHFTGAGSKIDWMSACAFMVGPLWESCIGTLLQGASLSLDTQALPEGVEAAAVLEGATLYNRGYQHWVLGG